MKHATLTLVPTTAGSLASSRPGSASCTAARLRPGNGIVGSIAGAAWLSATRKPMTVPTFHDRWPLCSTT